jgi:hypothetical protein
MMIPKVTTNSEGTLVGTHRDESEYTHYGSESNVTVLLIAVHILYPHIGIFPLLLTDVPSHARRFNNGVKMGRYGHNVLQEAGMHLNNELRTLTFTLVRREHAVHIWWATAGRWGGRGAPKHSRGSCSWAPADSWTDTGEPFVQGDKEGSAGHVGWLPVTGCIEGIIHREVVGRVQKERIQLMQRITVGAMVRSDPLQMQAGVVASGVCHMLFKFLHSHGQFA